MSRNKLYRIDSKYNANSDILEFIIGIVVYAVVLLLAQALFRNIYVENFFYALIAALILSILNYTIKPLLIYWTLPLNIITFGITYPIVNIIILKVCDLLMGSSFKLTGFFATFFIAIFISIMKIVLDNLITKNFRGR